MSLPVHKAQLVNRSAPCDHILGSQGSASSIVKMRLMGLTELEYMFQAGCLALNCLLDYDDARMTYSCALNLRFGLGDETLVYTPRRNS